MLLLIITAQVSFAQITLNFGPELGLAISRFPVSEPNTAGTDHIDKKTSPLYSPVVGLHIQMVVRKLFLFTTGIQYMMTGQHMVFHNEGYDSQNQLPFIADVDEKQSFSQLSLPLSAGITFPFLKIHFSVYGGWRINYFFNGKYSKIASVDYTKNSIDVNDTTEFNPLRESECAINVKPINNQLFYGISVSKGRFEVAINRYIGKMISYSKELIVTNYIDFKNNCNSITLRYRFFGFRNEKTHCNMFANKY